MTATLGISENRLDGNLPASLANLERLGTKLFGVDGMLHKVSLNTDPFCAENLVLSFKAPWIPQWIWALTHLRTSIFSQGLRTRVSLTRSASVRFARD